jgi:hypothetical protein
MGDNSGFFSLFLLPLFALPVVVIVKAYLKHQSEESQQARSLEDTLYESEEAQELLKGKPSLHHIWTNPDTHTQANTRSNSAELVYGELKVGLSSSLYSLNENILAEFSCSTSRSPLLSTMNT